MLVILALENTVLAFSFLLAPIKKKTTMHLLLLKNFK